MKKLIMPTYILTTILLAILLLTACATQRQYPKYDTTNCNWDTNTYKSNMQKKHK
jgi:outer membrane biogenesis lipoprotein LolB